MTDDLFGPGGTGFGPGGDPGGGAGGDGVFSTSSTVLHEARITISAPRRGFVGGSFDVKGTAFVRMKTTEFIKAGGQGKTITSFAFVTKANEAISIQINGKAITPTRRLEGGILRWSHRVTNTEPGQVSITASLTGTVTETKSTEGAGAPQHHSTTRRYTDTDETRVTVDFDGPEVDISEHTISIGPPWHVILEGTAEDEAGLQPLQWELDRSTSGTVENLSGDWSRWRALVGLPDRSESHEIIVSARDKAGNNGADSIMLAPDSAPPILAIIQPPLNPHRVLWQEGGITVPVMGIAVDTESKLQTVMWRLDDGQEQEAQQTGDNWSTWSLEAAVDSPGVHTVALWGTDMSGNTSEPVVLEVRVQVSTDI